MSKAYWKCTLVSGKGGYELGEHRVVVYTEKTDDNYPNADTIELTVNQRFTNPGEGPYELREIITRELDEAEIARLHSNPNYLI